MSAISPNFYFFTKWWPLKNCKKCLLFHLKSSFRSRDIQFFVFLSFPLFLPVGYCCRGWSKINLKVHDAINCLNKNSVTHFVWYLGKEKRYDDETLSIDRVSDKDYFYGKIIGFFFFHKIIQVLLSSSLQTYHIAVSEGAYLTRSTTQNKIKPIHARTKIFENSFFPYQWME